MAKSGTKLMILLSWKNVAGFVVSQDKHIALQIQGVQSIIY